jgi:deoxyribonuclease V
MIVFVDVDYRPHETVSACVGIHEWADRTPCVERVTRSAEPAAPYLAGQFYLREMPWLVSILRTVDNIELAVIDGYVWLAKDRPGLGAHLYERLLKRYPVAGVAKGVFRDNDSAIPVVRGGSSRPLYVTAVGADPEVVAAGVARMHGRHRMPTILKLVDRLSRDS